MKIRSWWLTDARVDQVLVRGNPQEVRMAFSETPGAKIQGEHVWVVERASLDEAQKRIAELEALVESCRSENMTQLNYNLDICTEYNDGKKRIAELEAENARYEAVLSSIAKGSADLDWVIEAARKALEGSKGDE